jgi:hypothetical protein
LQGRKAFTLNAGHCGRNIVRVGDLVVNKGFLENGVHYGAWGAVMSINGESANVRFSMLHSPRPVQANKELMNVLRFMSGKVVLVQISEVKSIDTIQADDSETATVWEWFAPISGCQVEMVRAIWIDVLRSGSYRQTRHCLHDRRGYSAMGVACDIIGKRYGVTWRHMERVCGILGNYTTMPKAFLKLLGIDEKEAEFIEKMSDNGIGFTEIAGLIADRHAPAMRLAS